MIRPVVPLAAAVAILAGMAPPSLPAALRETSPGLWELRRLPDGKPTRLCVADVMVLGQIEHHDENCSRKVVSSDGSSSVLRYSCPAGGFGESRMTLVTPRSLTIQTQGISGGLPFNYTVQARRIGDCPGS